MLHGHLRRLSFARPAPRLIPTHGQGHLPSRERQPPGQVPVTPEPIRLASQDQKDRLGRVLGGMGIAEDALASRVDHAGVALDQFGEGFAGAAGGVLGQQFPVG
jgi:hypothetical protein